MKEKNTSLDGNNLLQAVDAEQLARDTENFPRIHEFNQGHPNNHMAINKISDNNNNKRDSPTPNDTTMTVDNSNTIIPFLATTRDNQVFFYQLQNS
jgi:hypothetical protein